MLRIFWAFTIGCILLCAVILWAWLYSEKTRKEIGMANSKTYTLAMDAWWWMCLIGEMVVALFFGLLGAAFNFIAILFTGFIETIRFLRSEPQSYDQTNQSEKDFV